MVLSGWLCFYLELDDGRVTVCFRSAVMRSVLVARARRRVRLVCKVVVLRSVGAHADTARLVWYRFRPVYELSIAILFYL